jgi:hypothetical protein
MSEESENARRWIPKVKEIIELKTQSKIVKIYPINSERHFVFVTETGLQYQMLFKREFFNSFGKIFNKKGIGESINKEYVEYALNKGIHNFLFIHDNKIYVCPVKEFHDYAISNKTIRETASGETTFSVPVLLLSRWSP